MKATRLVLPLRKPLATSRGVITERRGILVTTDRDGGTAMAEATPHPELSDTDPETLFQRLVSGELDGAPPEAAAVSAWLELDERARVRNIPVAALLSVRPASRVPLNALLGLDGGPSEAVAAVADGFRTIKVKVGGDPDEALARLAAIRQAVGPDVSLRADANGAWDPATAAAALQRLASLDLEYVEDPVAADEDWSVLAGCPVPLAIDAAEPTDLHLDVATVLVLKPVMLPPFDAMARAERARDHGADVVVTSIVDGAVGVGSALQVAAALGASRACGLATSSLLAADVSDPPPIRDGSMWLDRPGVGVVLDVRRLAQVAVTSFSNVSNG